MAPADKKLFFEEIASDAETAVYTSIRKLCGKGMSNVPPLSDQKWPHIINCFTNISPTEVGGLLMPQRRKNQRREISSVLPTTFEILNAIEKLRRNKAPGPDNLNTELFKTATLILTPLFEPLLMDG